MSGQAVRNVETDRDDASGKEGGLVPSRRQYLDLKAQHPQAILLYRLGDFYETFDEDAQDRRPRRPDHADVALVSAAAGGCRWPVSRTTRSTTTSADCLRPAIPIAIAEQMSEPGRGLVERAITRVVTPGTVAEPASVARRGKSLPGGGPTNGERIGLAWVDVSTGEFAVVEFAGAAGRSATSAEELSRPEPGRVSDPR